MNEITRVEMLAPGYGQRSVPVPLERIPDLVHALVEPVTDIVELSVDSVAGRTLAVDLRAFDPFPAFDQAAVDGFAFPGRPNGIFEGTVRAGEAAPILRDGSALRVMTGALLPSGAEWIAPQKACRRSGACVISPPLPPGANIRRRGEDVTSGDLLVRAGVRLDARHAAILAATGHTAVPCLRSLRVAIVATGSELTSGVPDASRGQVRDSNSPMLSALMSQAADIELEHFVCPNDPDELTALLCRLVPGTDLIVTSGGMSFGLEDHVHAACSRLGSGFVIEAVAMKPGKPVGLARLGRSVLLGLPGSAFAALVSFLVVGRVVIARLRGRAGDACERDAIAAFELDRRPGRVEFFPARVRNLDSLGRPVVERLGKGGGARLAPLVAADGLCRIQSEVARVAAGDDVSFCPFATLLHV